MEKPSIQYEFGGPVGTLCNVCFLPVLVLCLLHWSHVGHVTAPQEVGQALYDQDSLNGWWGVAAWLGFQVLLERWLPCRLVPGTVVQGIVVNTTSKNNTNNNNHNNTNNTRLLYRINGHLAFWVTWMILLQIGYPIWTSNTQEDTPRRRLHFAPFPLSELYHSTQSLAVVTMILCFIASLYFYLHSFRQSEPVVLAVPGTTGNPIYDFWMGRELNPRSFNGTLDWKEFCELRPGLLGWMLLDLACLYQQYQVLGYVSGSMMLLVAFQGFYVWDALYQEEAILTTMDITTDGFGFMLLFGDLAWVPFTYSLQARYLVDHDPDLSTTSLLAIVALHLLGYAIFRGANGQKDAFRKGQLPHMSFLQTKRGTKLLTDGFWGAARKINYTGDWIMGLTWCLVCGCDSIVPYFYAIYFLILLVHRSIRDDHLCQQKYGADWDLYKQMVPYRFIPGVV